MLCKDKIIQLAKANISCVFLKKLVENGELKKTTRGVYILPSIWDDEFIDNQSQFKKGIYARETALLLHDLTDLTPVSFTMNFPESYNLTNVKKAGIKASNSKELYYNLGIDVILSPSGNEIKVYNIEKTLRDILRPHNNTEKSVIIDAFKRYVSLRNKDIPKLSSYAKILKVDEKVRTYLEILI